MGRIGVVNWGPDSYVGDLFRAVSAHVPPTPGAEPAVGWGDAAYLQTLWGDRVELHAPRKQFMFRFPSVEHHLEFFARHYGPTVKAMEAVGDGG